MWAWEHPNWPNFRLDEGAFAARIEAFHRTAEMDRFLEWYNADSVDMAGPIRASIAHLWFECIHPFGEGNGRVGRTIADHALSQALGRPTRDQAVSAESHGGVARYLTVERPWIAIAL